MPLRTLQFITLELSILLSGEIMTLKPVRNFLMLKILEDVIFWRLGSRIYKTSDRENHGVKFLKIQETLILRRGP